MSALELNPPPFTFEATEATKDKHSVNSSSLSKLEPASEVEPLLGLLAALALLTPTTEATATVPVEPVISTAVDTTASLPPSPRSSRTPSPVLASELPRPSSSISILHQGRRISRTRSLTEEIADAGELVPDPHLSDLEDEHCIPWTAALDLDVVDTEHFIQQTNVDYDRQRASISPRTRARTVFSPRIPNRTLHFRRLSLSPLFPSTSFNPHIPRHSVHGLLTTGPQPNVPAEHHFEETEPSAFESTPPKRRRSNSLSAFSFGPFRTRKNVVNNTLTILESDPASPVPKASSELDKSRSRTTHDTSPTQRSFAKLHKFSLPKMFKNGPGVVKHVEKSEEVEENGDIVETVVTTTRRRPSTASRAPSVRAPSVYAPSVRAPSVYEDSVYSPSRAPSRSIYSTPSPPSPATPIPATPEMLHRHIVENLPEQLVANSPRYAHSRTHSRTHIPVQNVRDYDDAPIPPPKRSGSVRKLQPITMGEQHIEGVELTPISRLH